MNGKYLKYLIVFFGIFVFSIAASSAAFVNESEMDLSGYMKDVDTYDVPSDVHIGWNDMHGDFDVKYWLKNLDGDNSLALCVNSTLDAPNGNYEVNYENGNVPDDVKKVLMLGYRENNTAKQNIALQLAVWSILDGKNPESYSSHYRNNSDEVKLAYDLLNRIKNDINLNLDKLTYSELKDGLIVKYYFTFFFGIPDKSAQQSLIMVNYNSKVEVNISTSAKDNKTGNNTANPENNTVITDTIYYENLNTSKNYTVTGILMDKETGKPLLINGKTVTATKNFRPTTPNGFITLDFIFDASGLGGKTIVVFEKLFYNEDEIASHEDLTDLNQTIIFNEEEPEEPEEPEDPSGPTNPLEPQEPEDPKEPNEPKPQEPEDPKEPNEPKPQEPEEPKNPEGPKNPDEPKNPEGPKNPSVPKNPNNPQKPQVTEKVEQKPQVNKPVDQGNISMAASGNPLIVLLLSVFALFATGLRNIKK